MFFLIVNMHKEFEVSISPAFQFIGITGQQSVQIEATAAAPIE